MLSPWYFQEKYPETWKTYFTGHAHSNIFEMLSGIGLLGTGIWILWNYRIIQIARSLSEEKGFYGDLGWSFFCAWIVLHLNGLTQVNFWEGKVLHQMMCSLAFLLIAQIHSTHKSSTT